MENRGKEWTPQEVWQIIGELSRISAGLAEAFAKKPEKPHYTIPEAMDFLGVTRKTVIAHISAGDFGDTIQLDARHILITAEGMQQYLESKKTPARRRRKRAAAPGPI